MESVGYLLEELRNPETLEAFRKDVESANMFIGSLIFVQEVLVFSILLLDGLFQRHHMVISISFFLCAVG